MLDSKLVSLHKHWITADAIKQVVSAPVDEETGLPEELQELAKYHSMFQRLTVLYSLLYIVVEGYRELKYENKIIDDLLANEDFVDALRLFRNAIFHYQKQPIPEKAMKFLELTESELWIRKLHSSFGAFFEKELPIGETLNQLKA
ncbi:hypothetical protein PTRA_a1935 [Pseudoalteromonas translucida KMM 520]|uniref:Uncharacterized protein n=1 Tax=Pseudoalteromonas translucida KMM 520 TaxID=1315283 RepID=A0A0U2NGZ2_9GAMM|nr:hypothetical protein [Pseudoalteromonas translucida]ALS33075.1 hypothetical protein PTRA_a1935 [Pseudoalteromonas translucida KMM 520]